MKYKYLRKATEYSQAPTVYLTKSSLLLGSLKPPPGLLDEIIIIIGQTQVIGQTQGFGENVKVSCTQTQTDRGRRTEPRVWWE